jgi:hypothetical protein
MTELPYTYYDHLRVNNSFLIECVRRDIKDLQKKKITGPLDQSKDLNAFKLYSQYVKNELDKTASPREIPFLFNVACGDYFLTLNFELFSRKTFYLADNLVEHLAVTDLNLGADLIRLPFESCQFVITSPIAFAAARHVPALADAANAFTDYSHPISVFLSELPVADYIPDSENIVGERKLMIDVRNILQGNKLGFFRRDLLLKHGWKVDDVLSSEFGEINLQYIPADSVSTDLDFRKPDAQVFFRIILNAIFYISVNQEDLLNVLIPKRAYREIARKVEGTKEDTVPNETPTPKSRLNYSIVGSNIQPITIRKQAESEEKIDDQAPQAGAVQTKRVLVRGHWRSVAYGPKQSLRRWQHIAAYYRGPDEGEEVNKSYKVD